MDLVEDPDLSDSGMESLAASKDETPERKPETIETIETIGVIEEKKNQAICPNPCQDYSDEADESLCERLWGLTEMFPEELRDATSCFIKKACCVGKSTYEYSRAIIWIIASSSVVLFAPVIFELERAQVEEMQKSQQKQVLLGPNAAMAGSGGSSKAPC